MLLHLFVFIKFMHKENHHTTPVVCSHFISYLEENQDPVNRHFRRRYAMNAAHHERRYAMNAATP